MKNVIITSRENAFEDNLANAFIREGYNVYIAGSDELCDCEKIDIYIDVSDKRDAADSFTIRDGLNEEVIYGVYNENVLKPLEMLEKHMHLLNAGDGKRICFLSAAEASINETRDKNGYAYKLSKAAMHNFFHMAMNKLDSAGYTWRVFDPMNGEVDPVLSAEGAFNYFTRRRGTENHDPQRDDEKRLVFRDALGREHTW